RRADAAGGAAMLLKLKDLTCGLSLEALALLTTLPPASAQAPSVAPPPLAGPPSPEHVQPWGLPPPPPGIGPVALFADIHDQPQGKFLEGGAFDKVGNLWFVPVFNCNPQGDIGPACEPQGTRWHDGKLYVTTRHLGILVYEPESKKLS